MSHLKYYLLLCLIFALSFCSAQKCKDIPKTFKSYAHAESAIKSTKFKHSDQITTKSSSWIRNAKYYTCDAKIGFFILTTSKGKQYIFQDMPINLWANFKKAKSFGAFYNSYIKDKYQIKIKP